MGPEGFLGGDTEGVAALWVEQTWAGCEGTGTPGQGPSQAQSSLSLGALQEGLEALAAGPRAGKASRVPGE